MYLLPITNWFMRLSRLRKQIVMAMTDACLLIFSLWSAFSLRFGEVYLPDLEIGLLFLAAPFIATPVFIRFGLYRAIIRYIGMRAIWTVVKAVSLYALLWAVLALMSSIELMSRSVPLINWVVAILMIGGSRIMARWWFVHGQVTRIPDKFSKHKVVIYGAGDSGVQLATALSYNNAYQPIAFIDDDLYLQGQQINALPVYAFKHLGELIDSKQVDHVLLAIPSVTRSRRKQIIKKLEPYHVHVKTLPGLPDMADGKVRIEDIVDVDIDDLLGREHVAPMPELVEADVRDKVVMVTGAGGSIGSELCRQVLKHDPKRLLLFEQNEYALYSIEHELSLTNRSDTANVQTSERKILPILGTILDQRRIEQICESFGVETIYHAAAFKHVPMVEMNPIEAVQNNIMGTVRTAQAAINTGVDTFVLISTDKAVRPTNTMGATKRFAELVLQGLSKKEKCRTRFIMVRFGNVLDSSGSVIPLFRRQIQYGGPVTVTDPRIIRYFMTITEAAELVIQAGAMGHGGDVFVLDMGEPVKILDLAQRMIRLSGLDVKDEENPEGDIEIKIIGLRPGEKLYEELLIGGNVTTTTHPSIMRAEEEEMNWNQLEKYLDQLDIASREYDQNRIRSVLQEAVKGFIPQCGIEDLIYKNTVGIEADNVMQLPVTKEDN